MKRVHSNLTSGDKTVSSSEIYLLEYHGIKHWREEGPRKMVNMVKQDGSSRITCSKSRTELLN